MKLRLAAPLTRDSIVDGPGLRAVIWAQGCLQNCPGCHNPCTHDLCGGFLADTSDVIAQLATFRLQRGITLSGGEPFLQPLPLTEIAAAARRMGLDVWAFSGYTWETLTDPARSGAAERLQLLRSVDVLVDGPFVRSLRDLSLRFRGSSNQRIIDVSRSLAVGAPVTIDQYMRSAVGA